MLRLYVREDGYVWCQFHGAIHERSSSPYGLDERPECAPEVWRTIYWRTRAGDYERTA